MTLSQVENPVPPCDMNQHGSEQPASALLLRISRCLLPTVILLFLVPFVALQFYSVPAVDDFCKATLSFNAVPQPTVLSITWMYYTHWSPRWLTTLLQSFLMSRFDLVRAYPWLLLAVLLANVGAVWYFFRAVFRFTVGSSLLIALVFYSAYVASLTDPEQQILWVTGAIEYNLSFSTLLVLVSALCRPRKQTGYFVLIGLLSIALPAQHEIAGAFLFAILLGGIIISRVQEIPAMQWYLSLFSAFLSQVVVMLSPGNKIRAAQEHRHLWDLAHIPRWAGHSLYHSMGWLAFPSILLAGCCAILVAKRGQGVEVRNALPPAWLGAAGICAMIALCGEMALTEVAMGTWIPSRTIAWFQFMFWLCFVCVVLIGIPELFRVRFSVATRLGVYLLFAVSLLGSANFRAALDDLRGTAQAWHQIDAAQLRRRGGTESFELPARYPKLALRQRIASDSGCWVNQCLANYLHTATVIGKDSSEECPH